MEGLDLYVLFLSFSSSASFAISSSDPDMAKLEGDIDILSPPSYKAKLLVEVFKFSHVYWIYLVNN
ncbi:unnamed protein product, partial [Musa acuminata var. zebrina]